MSDIKELLKKLNVNELKKLSPEERIKRIKEIDKIINEEKEKLKKLKELSEEELNEEVKKKLDIPILQITAESIEDLLTEDEKEIFRNKRFIFNTRKENLEDSIVIIKENQNKINNTKPTQPTDIQYNLIEDLYKQTTYIANDFYNNEQIDLTKLYEIKEEINKKKEYMEKGIYSPSEQLIYQLSTTEKIIDDLIGKYKK